MKKLIILYFLSLNIIKLSAQSDIDPFYIDKNEQLFLSMQGANHFSTLALKCIQQEYPNKTGHVMVDSTTALTPRSLHPAFYGCFDWHSSVHGHWMLVRLLKLFPDLPNAHMIRDRLSENLTRQNIEAEVEYFKLPTTKSFERMYGWAWLLKLSEELMTWNDAQGRQWLVNLQPLTEIIVERYFDFLPKQTYPINTGVHPNTAFGLSFGLDYARKAKNDSLENLIVSKSLEYFKDDQDCPAEWEPGGEDFFSPCLLEAELISKILDSTEFEMWFGKFLPGLKNESPETLLYPAIVSDRSDPKIVHLDGLNISKAWCMMTIANVLPETNPSRNILINSAYYHLHSTIPYVASGEYAGEHWLASFAVYALSLHE